MNPILTCLAPNASPLTYHGTNTFIIGTDETAIIDPGPMIEAHLQNVLRLLKSRPPVKYILVTHSHVDHSQMARPLSDALGVPIYAFGDSYAGRSTFMQKLAKSGVFAEGGGTEHDFHPDVCLLDGEKLSLGAQEIGAIWTPGHMSNHMCFSYNDCLFTGDHIMGWASTMIAPPAGDLGAYLRVCAALLERDECLYYPAHGDPIKDGKKRVSKLIAHRKKRTAQILHYLRQAPHSAQTLYQRIYPNLSSDLQPIALRTVMSHLLDLYQNGQIGRHEALSFEAKFHHKM